MTISAGIISYTGIILAIFRLWRPEGSIAPASYAMICVLVSLLWAIIIAGIVFLIENRNKISPYIKKIYIYRSLLYQLVRRDFLAKYKRSILGILWSLLNPLLTMIVMVVVFSYIFRFDIENFPVYVLSGQLIFNLFNEATTSAMGSVIGNSSLIKKVAVPRYIFPLSKVITALVNMALSLLAFIIVMIVTGETFHVSMLVMFLPIVYTFLFALGVGLFLSAELVFFRDINYLYSLLIFTLGYFTPLFYPISIIPDKYMWLIRLNPLVHYVQCFRDAAIYGVFPSLSQHCICIVIAVASLVIGLYVFYKRQDKFILHL